MKAWKYPTPTSLETENRRLKRLLLEGKLHVGMLKYLNSEKVTSPLRREAVAHLKASYKVYERRACRLLSSWHPRYWWLVDDDDWSFRERLKELCHELRRFGYRLLYVLLERGASHESSEAQKVLSGKGLQVMPRYTDTTCSTL